MIELPAHDLPVEQVIASQKKGGAAHPISGDETARAHPNGRPIRNVALAQRLLDYDLREKTRP
ncbi:hypothetical protein [Zhihengliuella halotolerans]|uniref:hypothetical protein n=1 Tax=Zhihengliuella halotolerans TaxID=370736 RepID=UPI000C7FAB38|nr:hypothetical protein [Zhihengliuella halotolerans]